MKTATRTKSVSTLLKTITLAHGSHSDPESGMCAMEAVAFVTGAPHSDHPECASPAIAAFLRSWNDSLGDDDRNRIIKPLLKHVIGTKSTKEIEVQRSYMSVDWFIREYTPAWLELAGIDGTAKELRALPEITNLAETNACADLLGRASKEASAADSAAYSAADSAAHSAADSAADSALAPTNARLQESAVKLYLRMCACK